MTFPIADSRLLDPARRKGFFRLRKREISELLRPEQHHHLVYRVDGRFVLDEAKRGVSDDDVVDATNVSMVDMRRNAPVEVEFTIPSGDAADFHVLVTFTCTVTDPVAVVRDGIDAERALLGYLRHRQMLFELGLKHTLTQINEVRRSVSAEVNAYVTIMPPTVPGLDVELTSVEVRTPESVGRFHEGSRDIDFGFEHDKKRLGNVTVLEVGEARKTGAVDGVTQDNEQRLAMLQEEHRQRVAKAKAAFERGEFVQNLDMIGGDPYRALVAAHAAGEITANDLAVQLTAIAERKHDEEREERREQRAAERAERQAQIEDTRRVRDQQREDAVYQMRVKADLLKDAAGRGQFDMVNIGLDQLYADIVGLTPAPAVCSPPTGPPTGVAATAPDRIEPAPATEATKAQVREEDE
jgi:hypothetical protein